MKRNFKKNVLFFNFFEILKLVEFNIKLRILTIATRNSTTS